MEKPELFICACHSSEHQLIIRYDKEDKEIYIDVHLRGRRLFGRIFYAIKYIFGYKCRYGNFEEFIFNQDDIGRLQELLNNVVDDKKPT